MPYTIDELTDDRNRSLFADVSAKIPIQLEPSDSGCWGERTQDGSATVYFTETAHPIACFTHELLHIKLNLEGLARPGFTVRADSEAHFVELRNFVGEMLPFMYNQLAHHRFFDEFVGRGFPPGEFLHDRDQAERERVLKEDLPKLARLHLQLRYGLPLKVIMPPYLFCSSPHDNGDAIRAARKSLRKYGGGQTHRFDGLLKDWRADPTPDVRVYLARLCRICDLVDTGFGKDDSNLIWSSAYAGT